MKFICSLITVSDIENSRYFYETILNQKVKFDFGENVTFHGDFAIHLKSHFQNLIDNKEIKSGGNNFELYFEDNNIEKIVELLHENNVEFIHKIKEQPWRQKVIRFYDPDKHIIEIGESIEFLCYRLHIENIDVSEISKITYMPIEFVEKSIRNFTK